MSNNKLTLRSLAATPVGLPMKRPLGNSDVVAKYRLD
jgi:hypothetical protein